MLHLALALGLAHAETPALPTITVRYTRDVARLTLTPPPGEHIEPDAPVSGWLQPGGGPRYEVATDGRGLAAGVFVAVPGADRSLSSALRVSLCQDVGSACRVVDLGFEAPLPGRKGEVRVEPFIPRPEERVAAAPSHGPSFEEARARATAEGKTLILDFGAIWCPPCNLLTAEVLDDPANAADLSHFVVARVDVDTPESWPLKDRYHVGGYPTLIAVDQDGAELDRTVGYTTEAAFLAWLGAVGKGPALGALPAPESVDARTALGIVTRLMGAGEEEKAAAFLARLGPDRAPELQEEPALRLARFQLAPSATEATWLLERGVPVMDWLGGALPLAEKDPALRTGLRAAVLAAIPTAPSTAAVELLDAAATLAEQDGSREAASIRLAAALLLNAAIQADDLLARAYTGYLADLYAQGGALDEAQRVLVEAMARWPGEFTWPYALGELLLRADKPDLALEPALAAISVGYGDNRLRAARLVARALHAAGRSAEALELLDETLAGLVRPAPDLDVRTHRYIQQLEETRAEVQAALKP